jgi:hypothetical protein
VAHGIQYITFFISTKEEKHQGKGCACKSIVLTHFLECVPIASLEKASCIMKTTLFLCWSMLVSTALGLQTFNNVPTYFGGTDNDSYLTWANAIAANHSHSVYLYHSPDDEDHGMAIHWSIVNNDTIRLALAARATGWMALGFSENGGMYGSDVVYWEAEKPDILNDAYILDTRGVSLDDCQDWKLIASQQDDEFIMIQASRLLNTSDTQDRVLQYDASVEIPLSAVIAAWGDDASIGYHGDSHALSMIRWFSDSPDSLETEFERRMSEEASGSFIFQVPNYTIPQRDTTYHRICMYWDDVLAQGVPNQTGLSFISIRPILNPNSAKYVHHAIVYTDKESDETKACSDTFYMNFLVGWAPGNDAFMLPKDVGYPFGPGVFTSFQLEVHYNNPDLDADIVDDFAIELFYTDTPRKIEAGVLELGDPLVTLNRNPVGDGIVEATFQCQGGCSQFFLQQPVTVFHEYMHMHKAGVSMYNKLVRDDKVERTAVINYYDFMMSGSTPVQQRPYTVYPGDAFETTCTYNSAPGSNLTYGLSSQSEMCVSFIWYYPRQSMGGIPWVCGYGMGASPCSAEFTTRELSSSADIYRTFGTANDQCQASDTRENGASTTSAESMPSSSADVSSTTSYSHTLTMLSAATIIFCASSNL